MTAPETGYSLSGGGPTMTFSDKMNNKARELRGRVKRNAGRGDR